MSEQVKPASEQKPVAYLFEDGSAVSVADLEFSPEKSGQRVVPLYIAPQPDYKAQRDALLDVVQSAVEELRELKRAVGFRANTLEVIQKCDAAIASVKGGE